MLDGGKPARPETCAAFNTPALIDHMLLARFTCDAANRTGRRARAAADAFLRDDEIAHQYAWHTPDGQLPS